MGETQAVRYDVTDGLIGAHVLQSILQMHADAIAEGRKVAVGFENLSSPIRDAVMLVFDGRSDSGVQDSVVSSTGAPIPVRIKRVHGRAYYMLMLGEKPAERTADAVSPAALIRDQRKRRASA